MKLVKLLLLLISAILLTSCADSGGQVQDLIVAPDANVSAVEGKWEVTSLLYRLGSSIIDEESDYIGKEALFHTDAVVLGSEYTKEPSYKIKRVKTSDYLIYKYKTSPLSLGLQNEYINVITVLNQEQYFCELLQLDDKTAFIYKEDGFYKLERKVAKVSLEEVLRYIDVEESVQQSFGSIEPENLNSGVLLGFKVQSFDEDNELPRWEYFTYWIQMKNRELGEIYRMDHLLLPRKNGFWIIEQERITKNSIINDEIQATPLFNLQKQDKFMEDLTFNFDEKINTFGAALEKIEPSILKNIVFVGNDYISVESIDRDRGDRRTLQTYAVDNLEDKNPIKLSDLIGETAINLFNEGARSVITIDEQVAPNEENFALTRRNGYWTLKGRINFKDKDEELFREFNIKAFPPREMVSYDELSIPFDAVRLAVPDVQDVFSSPNNDFLVVITSSNIVIYSIEGYDVNKVPLARVELPSDSSVVMSEWSTDRYPDIWKNEMLKQGAIEIELN